MWCHLPTGISRRRLLQFVAVVSLIIAFFTTLVFAYAAHAAEGVNQTLAFQGRLTQSSGAVVPDGHYNIQFKIYQDGAGTSAGNPGGSLKWTESYVNNGGTSGVEVKNGYFSVALGTVNPFGNQVDWNQDTLWLSMNVAGSSASCTTFGSGTCTADGEMLPMKRMTATPFALNSAQLGGKTADNFVQLAQGVQEDASTNTPSIAINKTSYDGDFVQLQRGGVDALRINDIGDVVFGSAYDHEIIVADSSTDTDGSQLKVRAGNGGSGSGSDGGTLSLQGGNGAGTSGNGGNVEIDAGAKSNDGNDGYITIGTTRASNIVIGSTYLDLTQNILVGANDTSGNTTNVTVGNGANSTGGGTKIQAKDVVEVATDGVNRATFDNDGNLYLGNGNDSTTPADFKIQGTTSTADGVSGSTLTIQGGGAATGNTNGGNLELSGGNGAGTGSKGLVVIDTPTYKTAGVQTSATSTNITQSNIDSFGVLTLNASAANVTFTLGAPSLGASAAGRLVYVTAANGSQDFTLKTNAGAGPGIEQQLSLRQNTSTAMIWNGTLWTSTAGSQPTNLQDAYSASAQNPGDAQLTLNSATSPDGLVVRDSATDAINGPLLTVQSSSAASLFSVNSNTNELSLNPGAEQMGNGGDGSFAQDTWGSFGGAAVSRQYTAGNYIASGKGSAKVVASAASSGAWNQLGSALAPNTTYNMSFSIRLETGTFTDMFAYYLANGQDPTAVCIENADVPTTEWKRVTCSFTTPASGITSDNAIVIGQTGTGAHTYYVDNASVTPSTSPSPNVKVGSGTSGGPATLFQLDRSGSAPTATGSESLLGSMYYDTTLGKVQCYEADGWGTCGAAPDVFVSLSPEFSGAVMNGVASGTMSTDLCSDSLNINDGSSGQPSVCGTNETSNFYKWTSPSESSQTKAIYVTYQLPANFKQFIANSASLMGKTDSNDASVTYQIYRNTSSGLTACGSATTVSTGTQSSWQKVAASGAGDPAACNFTAQDSVVIKISMSSSHDAHAYVGNLGFVYSSNN